MTGSRIVQSWESDELAARVAEEGPYVEFLRVPDLSAGVYRLPAGGDDRQQPHSEDEIYVVQAGRALFESGGERREVGPGSVLFVPAGEPHRFHEIREELTVLVIFGPAEYSRVRRSDPTAIPR